MIIGDSLQVPAENTKLLRLSAKELLSRYGRRTYHMREDGAGLVAAEGEAVEFTLPILGAGPRCTGIAAVTGWVFAHDPTKGYLFKMKEDKSTFQNVYMYAKGTYRLLHVYSTAGIEEFYCVAPGGIYFYGGSSTSVLDSSKGSEGCCAVFRDRIFTAKNARLNYSRPFYGQIWTEERFTGGYFDFISEESGEILAMQVYKDKLYLFRKHGITCVRVLGDELNFKATHLPMKCGELVKNSVALCGENIGYFTDEGFFLFNGGTSSLAENSRFDEIDVTKEMKSVTFRGKYYSLLTRRDGKKTIYCYDPAQREAHFVENNAADIASGDELYFTRGTLAYRLTKKGISENFTPYFTARNVAFGPGEEKMLRAVAIEGEGSFTVTVTSENGRRTVRGKANETLKLRSPLRGSGFDLKVAIDPADADAARFCTVIFRFTEEDDDD